MIYYFIYETTNLVNGKKDRGIHKTNNIEDGYLGSGIAFLYAIDKHGYENFTREILEFCDSYDELLEKEKIYVNEEWVKSHLNYNLKTGGQSAGILSDESKNRISETLKEGYKSGRIKITPHINIQTEEKNKKISETLKERYKTHDHPSKGIEPWNKNKPGSQVAWNKGLIMGPHTKESNEKRSKTLKERYKTQEHPVKGREPWNKNKPGLQVAWNKGKEMKKYKCIYCDAEMNLLNLNKYHMDNCKFKNTEQN